MDVAVFDADDPRFEDALEIRRRVFVQEQGVPRDREVDGLDDEAIHFLLDPQDPVGTARVRDHGEALKVERVAVIPDHRGEGAGAALMDAVETYAKEAGYGAVLLDAQVPVVEFYEGLGYVAEGDTFEDAGIPHLTMRKSL